MLDMRKVERHTTDGWVEIQFNQLQPGDLFKLYDTGSTSPVEDGSAIYLAKGEVFADPQMAGNYGIEADEVETAEIE